MNELNIKSLWSFRPGLYSFSFGYTSINLLSTRQLLRINFHWKKKCIWIKVKNNVCVCMSTADIYFTGLCVYTHCGNWIKVKIMCMYVWALETSVLHVYACTHIVMYIGTHTHTFAVLLTQHKYQLWMLQSYRKLPFLFIICIYCCKNTITVWDSSNNTPYLNTPECKPDGSRQYQCYKTQLLTTCPSLHTKRQI